MECRNQYNSLYTDFVKYTLGSLNILINDNRISQKGRHEFSTCRHLKLSRFTEMKNGMEMLSHSSFRKRMQQTRIYSQKNLGFSKLD